VWTRYTLLILCFYERGSGSSGTVKVRTAERLCGSETGLNFRVKGNRK